MCLVALSAGQSRRFPLVVAANRDEYRNRPSNTLGWWRPWPDGPEILSGRDLRSGGTWLGLTRNGRMAMVTNVRTGASADPDAPSRGRIPLAWLKSDVAVDRFWPWLCLQGYAPFNLLALDASQPHGDGGIFWMSNCADLALRLQPGLLGLSNAPQVNAPWPKIEHLKAAMAHAVETACSAQELVNELWEALADRTISPDDGLPCTGIPLELERMLSATFVDSPDHQYGTCSSTVVVLERKPHGDLLTHVWERTYGESFIRAVSAPGIDRPVSKISTRYEHWIGGWPGL
jgi:uncharacterized protein with NRDE domain